MKKLILMICLSLFIISAYSQHADSALRIDSRYRIYQNAQKLKNKQWKEILSANPASAIEYNTWKKQHTIALACSYTMLGLGVYGWIATQNAGSDIAAPGVWVSVMVGLACTGLVVRRISRKHLTNAVNQYNSSLTGVGMKPASFDLMLSSNGLGLRMTF